MEYYVYRHKRLKDNSIFYIGKGKNGRFNDEAGRNSHWNYIVKKDGGFIAEIIKDELSDEEARKLEIDLINEIGLDNLSNIAEGGMGGNTRKGFTEEEYQKWLDNKSKAQIGKHGYWKDKKRPNHSNRIKEKHKNGLYTYEWLSEPKTETHKQKISESNRKPKPKTICDKCGKEIPTTHLAVHQRGKKCLT
jgi:hypothetical protein